MERPISIFLSMPPKIKVHIAMTKITANAPKSGSSNNNAPNNIITAAIGRNPFRKLPISFDFLKT